MSRTRFEASIDKRRHVDKCESEGLIADSMDVRERLMERVCSGEITLEQAQSELKRIKRNAKKNGMITRSQAYRQG